MSTGQPGGSRYLKQPFDYASEIRVEAIDRIMGLQFDTMEKRLVRIEQMVQNIERRMWVAVFGVVGVVASELIQSAMRFGPP
ncbi:MAG: hypothetical protein ACKVPY_07815 [Paracoccaceae bacterium]